MTYSTRSIVTGKQVIQVKVQNAQKEELGMIDDIVIDKVSGNIRYVVLSFGGFLGLGDKLFAIPWKSISYSPEEDCFILHEDKDKLKSAPGFDRDKYPEFSPDWSSTIDSYYDKR